MIYTFTAKERQALEKIDREALVDATALYNIRRDFGADSEDFTTAKKAYLKKEAERQQNFTVLLEKMERARFKKLETPADILKDAEQQAQDAIIYVYARIDANTSEEDRKSGRHYVINMASGGFRHYPLNWDYENVFYRQKAAAFNPEESLYLFDAAGLVTYIMRDVLALHAAALKGKPEADQLQAIVDSVVEASPYTADEAPEKAVVITTDSAIFRANMPMYHGKATDALAALSGRTAEENKIADKAVFQTSTGDGDFKIVLQDFSKLKGKLSVNTHKLLSTGIAEFTQINNYGGGKINPVVTIPLKEYARLLGYKIDERETASPEEAAKEKKRAAENLKIAKKRIRQDLELLQAMRWTWQEKVRGKSGDFDSILLLERIAIRNNYIIMEFGRNMAEYLKQLPLTQYPQGLLGVDARKENAYRLGLKMAEHYSIDNNQVRGTANRLKVSTLLSVTGLPTYEALQQETHDNSRHWDTRIKEPFETALDEITGKVISGWEYVKAKGEPLTEEEAYGITDYETFINMLVQFELIEAPDHEDRLARRAEEKKLAATKTAAKARHKHK